MFLRHAPRIATLALPCLGLLLVAAMPLNAATAADEIDAQWSPEMSDYRPAPQNWPLCGDISNDPNATWSSGQPCTRTDADRVVSTYGPRPQSDNFDFHRGIDLRTPEMELDNHDLDNPPDLTDICDHDCVEHRIPVFAVADATEVEIEYKCKSGVPDGFRVELLHEYDDGTDEYEWSSRYVHLSSVEALDPSIQTPTCGSGSSSWEWEPAITVTAGQQLGLTGKSRSNNHHLHFEVRKDDGRARDAVHPRRMLPDPPPVFIGPTLTVDLPGFGVGTPEVEIEGTIVDVVRVELHFGYCETIQTSVACSFAPLPGGDTPSGYLVDPPYFDYERSNYQFSHRGGSVWDDTNGFQFCPYHGAHDGVGDDGEYDKDVHLTLDDSDVHTFNGTEIEVFGGVTPYERHFRFEEVTLPAFDPTFDYTCLQAVAHTVAHGSRTSGRVCRSYAGGPFEPLP